MLQREFYCVGCGHLVNMPAERICLKTTRNGRYRMKATCVKCGGKLSRFISEAHYRQWLASGKFKACRQRGSKSKRRGSKSASGGRRRSRSRKSVGGRSRRSRRSRSRK